MKVYKRKGFLTVHEKQCRIEEVLISTNKHVRVTTHSANFSSRSGTFSHSEERQEAALAKLRMATV